MMVHHLILAWYIVCLSSEGSGETCICADSSEPSFLAYRIRIKKLMG